MAINFNEIHKQLLKMLENSKDFSTTTNVQEQGISRFSFTKEHKQYNNYIIDVAKQHNLNVIEDNIGNVIIKYNSANKNAKTLLLGSHQDSVPNGGLYDGNLGVLLPLALLCCYAKNNIKLDYDIHVLAFCDEEGTRFSTTLLGSKSIAGTLKDSELNDLDRDGISVRQAIIEFSGNPNKSDLTNYSYKKEDVLGFVEVHIEQGPILQDKNQPACVVSAITGIERHLFTINGQSGHAGTVPMELRKDALVGASNIVLFLDEVCKNHKDLVGVVGKIQNYPNGINVIPEKVELTLELRSPNDILRLQTREQLLAKIKNKLEQLNLSYEHKLIYQQSAVECDKELSNGLKQALIKNNNQPLEIFSGAGHDGLAMVDLCPIAMLFVRCKDGISHNPKESVKDEDLLEAIKIINSFLIEFK